ncbi:MAG: hypothetical protein M1813_004705 [Trichoglossum hirsutum]|nr:MAG: hypothetical protein M1813_004705 [Trichoglossum hirsutum]
MSSLILCYAAASQFLLPGSCYSGLDSGFALGYDTTTSEVCTSVSTTALFVLATGLFGQAIIGFWCFWSNSRQIVSWSSNPLTTTLAALHQGHVNHRTGRCLASVRQSQDIISPSRPLKSQVLKGCSGRHQIRGPDKRTRWRGSRGQVVKEVKGVKGMKG